MADIFVSYTSADREWAFWIAKELEAMGHTPHVHEWELAGGGDIARWMEERHHDADQVLCVISNAYLGATYSSWERRAAQWAAATDRLNFALPIKIEDCELPTMLATLKHCDLYGLSEDTARARLSAFMKPAGKPVGPLPFPGAPKPSAAVAMAPVAFPGGPRALSNIAITVPRYFLGRDKVLAEIKTALADEQGRVAITALHGMRGVGKTALAAAYADFHRGDYRATWWIRAETESTMRADLVGLGVRLGWVAPDEKEEPALATATERLRHEGAGILLIFDNAIDADSVEPYLPNGGDAQVIITSNAHAWRDVAAPMQIDTWPIEIGADYLVSRTGRKAERQAALDLSIALGGLPLAHEQAAAYCERLEVPLSTYRERYDAAPVERLNDERDAPRAFHNRLTAAKAFALAIDEAAKLHPAAEPLIVHAALLAPEPIPLFLFSEAREQFGEPLASNLANDGLDEAVAALRAFALIDRESIPDERDSTIATDCVRLHRLVRQVAASRIRGEARKNARSALVSAMLAVYPIDVWRGPSAWPRARRLDVLALALTDTDVLTNDQGTLLDLLAAYRHGPLAAYTEARSFYERALTSRERMHGAEHRETARSLNNLGVLLNEDGNSADAQPYNERALAIREKVLGPEHPETGTSLNNLAQSLHNQGKLSETQPLLERALLISEKSFGSEHPKTALSLNNLASVLEDQGDFARSQSLKERALAIYERELGPNHPDTATVACNLGVLMKKQGDLNGAMLLIERGLAIYEKTLGPNHPLTQSTARATASILAALGRPKDGADLPTNSELGNGG